MLGVPIALFGEQFQEKIIRLNGELIKRNLDPNDLRPESARVF